MTKPTGNMAISTFSDPDDRPRATCRVLLCHRGTSSERRQCVRHDHSFWQAEIVTAGPIRADLAGQDQILLAGDIVLLPPGTSHQFFYPAENVAWVSVKFSCEAIECRPVPRRVPQDDSTHALLTALHAHLPESPDAPRSDQQILEHLLAALLTRLYWAGLSEPRETASSLVRQINRYLRSTGGRRVTVAEVAGQLGYSVSHVSAIFRKDRGRTLKSHIDRHRARLAGRLLEFSDLSVTDVSRMLDFPDVFSFSRFFSRVAGQSPRQFRKESSGRGDSADDS
jgi:AraC-like DNA-binding protein